MVELELEYLILYDHITDSDCICFLIYRGGFDDLSPKMAGIYTRTCGLALAEFSN